MELPPQEPQPKVIEGGKAVENYLCTSPRLVHAVRARFLQPSCRPQIKQIAQAAKDHGCSIRIGVNAGSLEKDLLEKYGEPCPEALVESALDHIRILEDHGFREYKVAVKASDLFLAVAANQQLADQVDCPLHLGITEAGGLRTGTIKSSVGMGMLLWSDIGDTIRVSLTPRPGVKVARVAASNGTPR